MHELHNKAEMRAWARAQRAQGYTVGLVPTMGFLHRGHMDLLALAQREADVVVVSIYVNPTQFAAGEDFDVYPSSLDRDRRMLQDAGVSALFLPPTLYEPAQAAQDPATPGAGPTASCSSSGDGATAAAASDSRMVVGAAAAGQQRAPGAHDTYVVPERLQRPLCGGRRPHFFRGVATVVAKLFNITQPDIAVFGRKDYQQLVVIRAMVRDLDFAVRIVAGDTAREADGLATSSRNARLSHAARSAAPCIHAAMQRARETAADALRAGRLQRESIGALLEGVRSDVAGGGGDVEYARLVDAETLEDVDEWRGQAAVLAVAAWWEGRDGAPVRLIDNVPF